MGKTILQNEVSAMISRKLIMVADTSVKGVISGYFYIYIYNCAYSYGWRKVGITPTDLYWLVVISPGSIWW